MKTSVAISEEKELLARWVGAGAAVWMYHVTHRRMLIRLDMASSPQALFIAASGCEQINGPLKWASATIAIERADGFSRVTDVDAAFELRCSDVGLFIGVATAFDTSFDGWLNDE